jgi:hypothetical protein
MVTKPELSTWAVDDSSFKSYADGVYFDQNGPAHDAITSYLGGLAAASVLDIAGGSNGKAVQDLLSEGLVKKGCFTNLVDNRNTVHEAVDFVGGDLKEEATWTDISRLKEARYSTGYSLILHRPYGGLQEEKHDFYLSSLGNVLELLSPGGLFYAQVLTTFAYGKADISLLRHLKLSLLEDSRVENFELSAVGKTLVNHIFTLVKRSVDA